MGWASLLHTIFLLLLGAVVLVTLLSALDWVRVLLQRHVARRGLNPACAVRWRDRDTALAMERQPLIVGPTMRPPARVGMAGAVIVVGPAPRAVWNDRGWARRFERSREVYEGFYRVTDRRSGQRRAFQGRIVVDGRYVAAYIADPPRAIKRHPKGPCFMLVSAPWFRIHWHRPAQNVDDALLYVERVLDEALNR